MKKTKLNINKKGELEELWYLLAIIALLIIILAIWLIVK